MAPDTVLPPGYANIDRETFMSTLAPLVTASELRTIATAYEFSKFGHRGQTRKDHVRYFEHVRSVAWILVTELLIANCDTIVMALLHDMIEDSHLLNPERIEINFGKQVARGVQLLSKVPKDGYHQRLLEHGSKKVWLVKLADRLQNLRTLGSFALAKQKIQIAETQELYIPLSDKLIKRLPPAASWRGYHLHDEIIRICEEYELAFASAEMPM